LGVALLDADNEPLRLSNMASARNVSLAQAARAAAPTTRTKKRKHLVDIAMVDEIIIKIRQGHVVGGYVWYGRE
jgi:hypothetical protein